MRRQWKTCVVAVLLVLAFPMVESWAQETTGAVRGHVTSPDGESLPGVTITIINNETGLQRTAIADVAGEYQIMALPPGSYELAATLDGFQTTKRSLQVKLGSTFRSDLEMALGAITDVIEVTGELPLVDVTSTVTGITMNAGEINSKVPLVQDTQRIALLAPSTTQGDTAFNGAGDGTYGQKLVSIGGASVAENSYQLNGLNITNFRTGVGSSWIPFEFVEEVQVKTGGYEAEFGRSTGGVVNMVTKSGTNTLHGGASLYFEPASLHENEPNTAVALNQLEERETLEANLSLGGPVVEDRLFFFGFVQYRDTDNLLATNSTALRETGSEPYYGAKLDWNLSSAHRVELTYLDDSTSIDDRLYSINDGVVDFSTVNSQGMRERGGVNYIGKYTGIFSENLLLSLQYGENNFDRTDSATGDVYAYAWSYAVPGQEGTRVNFPGWTNPFRGYAEDVRKAARLDTDIYVGDHSVRAGVDYEHNWSDDNTEYSGSYRISYYLNNGTYPELDDDQLIADYRIYRAAGDFDVYSNAVYLQDSWALTPQLTLNLGVRWEQYENKNVNGETFIKVDDQYAPRLGVIWDPSGEGRSKLFASYGKYHLPIASNTNIRMAGTELYTRSWVTVEGYNPDGSPIGLNPDPLQPIDVYADGNVPDVREVVSENLEPMAQEELILGYERVLSENWSVGARGVMRQFASVIEDVGGDWVLYNVEGIDIHRWWGVLANPGEPMSAWVDVDGDGEVEHFSFTAEEMAYPKAERNYYAVELTARRRFADNWMLDLAYTWSHSYGNYEGYVDSTIGQSDGGITQLFDYPGLTDHSWGNLPNDRRANFKAFGVYAFDMGLQLGGNFYYQSGRPKNGQGIHPTDDWAASYSVASFYVQGEPAPRGIYGTSDDIWGLDAMLKYNLELGPGELSFRIDVFNLLNNDGVTEVDENGDLDTGDANPDFLTPTHYQSPRSVRFGIGYSF